MTAADAIAFRPLAAADLPMVHGWLARPHVAEWWGPRKSLADLEAELAPSIAGTIRHRCFIARRGDEDIGFIQWYAPADFHPEGWWLDVHDPGMRGIDQFLAHEHQLGRGLGTAMVQAFIEALFDDTSVTRIQTDPSPDNARAIRAYEKAGFRRVGEIDTPDGRALLMHCDRPASVTMSTPLLRGEPEGPVPQRNRSPGDSSCQKFVEHVDSAGSRSTYW